ncbi:unnamed protein product [Brachionus calyciflorus]|uniref:Membrane insertase YidC/Oxa/ALB C-terminal domain-containing protein n=1 Tax=Brachionus calyciflorus TaxID=104777 RepID=A0A813SRF2_9BILA|nr:unnamed protein product [Brachionus calyciflorus]
MNKFLNSSRKGSSLLFKSCPLRSIDCNLKILNLNSSINILQKRYESTSKIKSVELIAPQSDLIINTSDNQKFSLITDSPITHGFEDLLINLHDVLSLEWSSTIFLAAIVFRLSICFPIKVYQEHLMAKLVNLRPEITEALEKSLKNLKKDSIFMSPEIKRKITRQTVIIQNHFYKKENCQPQKIPISSVLQMPFWIYLSSATRNLTTGINDHSLQMEQINHESFMWITSLAASDPYYALPVAYCLIAFSNLIYASLNGMTKSNISKIFSFRKYLSVVFIFLITYFISNMPSSVGLFWISSNFLSLIELVILDSIFIRRLLRIPKTSVEPTNIYLTKMNALKSMLKFARK